MPRPAPACRGAMNSISARLLKGSLWLGVARAIVNLLTLLNTIIIARLLLPEDFGLVAIATTFLMIATTATELSMSQALVQHRDPQAVHFHTAWTLNLLRGLSVGAVFALSGFLVAALYGDHRLVPIMAALGFSLVMSGLVNPRRVMLQRSLIFWQDFMLDVSQKLVGVIVSIAIAWIYQSYWALVIGALATQLTNILVSYTVLPFRPKLSLKHARELFSFSLWLTFAQVINIINWRFEFLLIGKFLGQAELGHYSVGNNLAQMPTRETTAPLKQTLFPGFATLVGDPERLAAGYQRAQGFVTAVALPMGVGAALIADPLVRLAMGERWMPAVIIVQGLAAIFAIQTLGSLAQPLGMARGETRLLFMRDFQMFLVRVPLILGGLLAWGMVGVIATRIFTGLMNTVLNMMLVRRFTGLSIRTQLSANYRALIAISAMAAALITLSHLMPHVTAPLDLALQIAAMAATGAVVYCGVTAALWWGAGRPAGAESEFAQLFRKLGARLRTA